MSSFMLFITKIHALQEPQTLGILAFYLIIGIAFGVHQRNLHFKNLTPSSSIPQPLLDFEVLKMLHFGFTLVTIIAGFSFVVLLTYFPIFLSINFGLSASFSGLCAIALDWEKLSLNLPLVILIRAESSICKSVNSLRSLVC
ncbi:MAG: hypothetical protein K2O85_06915 [Helicobacter sp.]|nr:hypothetical protein [Helicobacter sp.]